MKEGHEIRIVTISRQAGAGGAPLAQILAGRLHWPVVDRLLLEEVARRLHAPVAAVEEVDEFVGGLLARTWKALARGAPDFMLAPLETDPDAVNQALQEVIRQVADNPPAIVVGRGAQCILHTRSDVLHVRVVAPWRLRAARVAEARNIPPEKAWEEADRIDQERNRYVERYYHCHRDEPTLYDVQLNTGGISMDEAAEIVLGIIDRHRTSAGSA
jgi:CMP/dCMP kinase